MEKTTKVDEIRELKKEIANSMEREEVAWKQRAKQQWLMHGDKNSIFFHHCTTQRRKVNCIESVADERGKVYHSLMMLAWLLLIILS